jgi:hypothetical protein
MKAWRKAAQGRTAKKHCERILKSEPWTKDMIQYLVTYSGWIAASTWCNEIGYK